MGPSKIAGVYGTFPRAIWNGGRTLEIDKPKYSKEKIKEQIQLINSRGLQCRMTFSNCLIKEEHLFDPYCNMILSLLDNGQNNAVIINSPVLEEYIKNIHPNLLLISSLTKGNDFDTFYQAINSHYYMVVAYPKRNILNYIKNLSQEDKNRIELLTDIECCYCKCNLQHYYQEAFNNLHNTYLTGHKCYKSLPDYSWEKESQTISDDERTIVDYKLFNDLGITNFKLQGRGENIKFLIRGMIYKLFKNNQEIYIEDIISSNKLLFL